MSTLIDHKANLQAVDRTGRTALHVASEYGKSKVVNALLKLSSGSEASEVYDHIGRNCFHLACCAQSVQSIDFLVGRKPKLLNSVDKHQRTGLFYAILNEHSDASQMITQRLLDLKAEVNFRDSYKKTALHYVCEAGKSANAMILLK